MENLSIELIATAVAQLGIGGIFAWLFIRKDKEKDQTYSLAFLPQVYLKNIIFPLGGYTKKEVYQLAKKYGLNFFEKIKQSQDFCFVAGKSMPRFLSQEIGEKVGLIQDKEGNILYDPQGKKFLDHDLNEIVEEFSKFAKEQKFNF